MKRRRNPSLIIAVVMLVAVGIIIGYAYLSKTLNINGTIGVTKNTWNVKFRNIQVENGSVEAAAPSLSNSDTTITITPTLDTFGDYYEFTVEVYNEGSIDAMLQAVPANPLSTEQQKLLEWSLTYDDGIELTANDILKSHKSDTLRVRVAYKTNIASENDLNSAGTSSISFTITYVQADSTANIRERVSIDVQGLIAKANAADATYSGVSDNKKKEMFAFDHTLPEEKTDYRYIGKLGDDGPNNYIKFNCTNPSNLSTCEEWRIIGVFDGKIKIIRSLGIDSNDVNNPTTMPWDYKKSGLGSSTYDYGSNDWSDAQLMYLLNRQNIDEVIKAKSNYRKEGNYIKTAANGNVIYELGKRPSSQANNLTTYTGTTATSWPGLTETAYSQVAEVTWNLGGLAHYTTTDAFGTTEVMYQAERGTDVYSGRPTTWIGKIALMYPSDYAYTFGKGIHDGCYRNPKHCYSGSTKVTDADPTTSWLFNSKYQWTLSPMGSGYYSVLFVSNTGNVGYNSVSSSYGVRPCVYLKSSIRLQGSGTSGDPYRIVED